jgi:alkylation response protein AidB-like acyl-CoA dehydrogenase
MHAAGEATEEDPPVLHAAIGLAEQTRKASDKTERCRRLPPGIAAAMKDAGVFGMAMPRAWGGPELDPWTQFRVIEALAMADGSVGWCAMIGCDGGYVTAFLDQDVARTMYPDFLVATGAAATTTGQAIRVPGGYRVSGRFPFVSGCHHCEWVWLGCLVIEDGTPRVDDNGVPETRQCFVPLSQCEILDTWHTTGVARDRQQRRRRARRVRPGGAHVQLPGSAADQAAGSALSLPVSVRRKGPRAGARNRSPRDRRAGRERGGQTGPALHGR